MSYDKLGDPVRGRRDPGRCHVCLAWTRYPFTEQTVTVCPDCRTASEARRERIREAVSEALEPIWESYQQATLADNP